MRYWLPKRGILVLPALALLFCLAAGCGAREETPAGSAAVSLPVSDGAVLGEGAQVISVVVDDQEETVEVEVHTDSENVGDALEQLGLIAGEEGPYGLYVKEVNGTRADYNEDGVYWAFYVDGEYASSSVDQTPVEEGAVYLFRIEE